MAPRCKDYLSGGGKPDIIIREDEYSRERCKRVPPDFFEYMDSGWLFYSRLLQFGGMMLHASAVELDGGAYLFSGPSGMGKSTHTRLWMQSFPNARIFNDDKPALRKTDGVWYAYGTPWCGKDGININLRAPLRAICFLRQGAENKIRRLSPIEATAAILSQTQRRFATSEGLGVLMNMIDMLISEIPIYELVNLPNSEAAMLSYSVMTGQKEK